MIVLVDVRDNEIVRQASREDIAIAKRYSSAVLITYRFGDAYSSPRHGYLARLERDPLGNDITTALDDSEIIAL